MVSTPLPKGSMDRARIRPLWRFFSAFSRDCHSIGHMFSGRQPRSLFTLLALEAALRGVISRGATQAFFDPLFSFGVLPIYPLHSCQWTGSYDSRCLRGALQSCRRTSPSRFAAGLHSQFLPINQHFCCFSFPCCFSREGSRRSLDLLPERRCWARQQRYFLEYRFGRRTCAS